MKRPITIMVDGTVIDEIRDAIQTAGLNPLTDEDIVRMAAGLGLHDIRGSYVKLADVERKHRSAAEPMVQPSAWDGALDARQAS